MIFRFFFSIDFTSGNVTWIFIKIYCILHGAFNPCHIECSKTVCCAMRLITFVKNNNVTKMFNEKFINVWFICHFVAINLYHTVYPKKYAHGFVVLCFVVVMQSFIMNSHEVFIHIHQGCFAGTGAIVRLPQCQWSKPDGYGKISQCITTTKHSKAKTVCIFLGVYCLCACKMKF